MVHDIDALEYAISKIQCTSWVAALVLPTVFRRVMHAVVRMEGLFRGVCGGTVVGM